MFARNDQVAEILEGVKKGAFLKMKGVTTIDRFDGQLTIGSVVGIKKISDFRAGRQDTYPEKRVETALPHQDERYGWSLGCKGFGEEGYELGA